MFTYYLQTYGCQMNVSDSERIHTYLQSNNFTPTDKNQADILIFNACSVRQSAIDRIYGQINNAQKHKTHLPLIIITGCVLAHDKKTFKEKNTLFLNIKDLPNWSTQINKTLNHLNTKTKQQDNKITKKQFNNLTIQQYNKDYFSIPTKHNTTYSAYVPIMTGCNNFCTYCAVPYTRGREQSRPVNDILKEIRQLIKQGYQEIILLGQNVNSYQGELNIDFILNEVKDPVLKTAYMKNTGLLKSRHNKIINFPTLLKLIDTIPGNYWLNFFSSHPKDLSKELINCFKTCQHLTPYLHLPLQSGSNKIIKKMNRHYTAAHYKKLIQHIKSVNPQIAITSDIIVGFPGETLTDFKATVELVKTIKFDLVYISQFSPRPHTVAAKFKDNITKTEKMRREKKLNTEVKKVALKINQRYLNQSLEVLVDKIKNKNIYGHTNQFKNVKILTNSKQPPQIGQLVKVKITKVTTWSLQGQLINK